MKITKFAALAGVALLAGVGAFAQATDDYNLPQGFTWSNEIGSDVVKVTGNAHKEMTDSNYRSEFGGIYDKLTVKYDSEKLAFELSPKFGISDANENYYSKNDDYATFGHGASFNSNNFAYYTGTVIPYGAVADADGALNSDDTAFSYLGFDWNLRFTPFDIVNFYLHGGPNLVGSKLFARDDNWGASKLGSDGFAIVTEPLSGLKISGAIPFSFDWSSKGNYLNAEVEDSWVYTDGSASATRTNTYNGSYKFRVDLGAEYVIPSGLVGVGAKVNDVINAGQRQYGIYAGLNMGALAANVGFNYSEDYTKFLDVFDNGLIKIGGKQAVAASASFTAGDFEVMADAMYNLKPKQSVYDAYAGAFLKYAVVPGKFTADVRLGVAMDLGTNAHHGTIEDDKDLKNAMDTIDPRFIDLYYSHVVLEDLRAAQPNVDNYKGVAASQNWQYYTALARAMSNGNLDTTSAARAALAVRIRPGFTYMTGKNEFGAHIDLSTFFDNDGSYQIKFPVYWKWSF